MTVPYSIRLLSAGALVGVAVWSTWPYMDVALAQAKVKVQGKKTVADRVAQFGEVVDARLAPYFEQAGVAYPPAKIVLVGYKEEKRLDLLASSQDGELTYIRSYPIKAASGGPGPKLRQGDFQVPEGLYRIELLNPNSKFHLSLRVNYPNAHDRAMGKRDGRTNLGSDIMIHGKALSAGCLAMGDPAAEDLFILAARSGHENIELVLTPADIRDWELEAEDRALLAEVRPWYPELVEKIRDRLRELPPGPGGNASP